MNKAQEDRGTWWQISLSRVEAWRKNFPWNPPEVVRTPLNSRLRRNVGDLCPCHPLRLPPRRSSAGFSRLERFAVNFAKPGQSNLILEGLPYLWYWIPRTVWGALHLFNQRPMLRFEVVWREGDTHREKERDRKEHRYETEQLTNPLE